MTKRLMFEFFETNKVVSQDAGGEEIPLLRLFSNPIDSELAESIVAKLVVNQDLIPSDFLYRRGQGECVALYRITVVSCIHE